MGLLAGCGNKNDGVTQNGKATEAMPETKENRKETPNAEINDKRATEPEETTVNDATDRSDADTGVGGAAKDIVDGVGDAGKDIIDGVEDAGDALTGDCLLYTSMVGGILFVAIPYYLIAKAKEN